MITEDENLDSVLFFTALLRREQSLKMCFVLVIFSCLTILGSRSKLKVGPKLGPKLGPKFEGDAPL